MGNNSPQFPFQFANQNAKAQMEIPKCDCWTLSRRHIQQQKDPEYAAYDYLYYDYYDGNGSDGEENSNRRRKDDGGNGLKGRIV